MPFRFRRSIRIAPGVRLNVGRRGVSASATLPGTGISYTLTTPHRGAGPRRSFTRLLGTVPHDRCGKDRMLNEVHTPERQRAMPIMVRSASGCMGFSNSFEQGESIGVMKFPNCTGVLTKPEIEKG